MKDRGDQRRGALKLAIFDTVSRGASESLGDAYLNAIVSQPREEAEKEVV